MKKSFLFCTAFIFIFIQSQGQQPDWEWACKTSSSPTSQTVSKMCTDNRGNVFVLFFNNNNYPSYDADTNAFITRYSNKGQLVWKMPVRGYPTDMGTDDSGNLYVTGSFTGMVQGVSGTVQCNGSSDIFVSKYNAQGKLQWLRTFGNSGRESSSAIAVTGDGRAYITGQFDQIITFDQEVLTDQQMFFIAALNSSGNIEWARKAPQNPSRSYGYASRIRLDKSGNAYLICECEPVPCYYACWAYSLMKYNPGGTLMKDTVMWWDFDDAGNLNVDENDNIYVTRNTGSHYTYSLDLTKYDKQLHPIWTQYLGEGYDGYALHTVEVFPGDKIFVFGWFGGQYMQGDTITIGDTLLTRKGQTDALIARINGQTGKYMECFTAGGTENDGVAVACADGYGNVFAGGVFSGEVYNQPPMNDTVHFGSLILKSTGNYQQGYVAKIKYSEKEFAEDVSLAEFAGGAHLSFYPNPTAGHPFITGTNTSTIHVRIHDITGICIADQVLQPHGKIDVSGFTKGVYIIESTVEGKVNRKKIILN